MKSIFIIIRRIVYLKLGLLDRIFGRVNPVLILCYHSIGDSWRFSVSKNNFEKQMQSITKTYTPVQLSDIVEYIHGKKKFSTPVFAVTFDDGYSDIRSVMQICETYHVRPTVFVLAKPEQATKEKEMHSVPFLSPSDMRELLDAKWEIGNHSATHPNLPTVSREALTQEILDSKKMIERICKKPVHGFCYPYGAYTSPIVQTVHDAGYQYAVTMDDGMLTQHTDPFLIPRVGVDKSHSTIEFPFLWSPSVVTFRNTVKKFI